MRWRWSMSCVIKGVVVAAQLHLAVSMEVLDPALAPGAGELWGGGWSRREAIAIIRGLGGMRLAGADVVEVAPAYDHAEVTAIAAANIVYELLCLFALTQGSA